MGTNGLRIDLLSSFGVGVGTSCVATDAWRRRKPAALVKILALTPGHRVHREKLMDMLWPDLDAAAAGANLRKAIHQARSALDTAERGAGRLVEFANDVVSLSSDGLVIDIDDFRAELTSARRRGDTDCYRGALAMYRGDLLPDDVYEEWAIGPRQELRAEYVAGLHELSDRLEADGDILGAVQAARELVAADPLGEDGHISLMRLFALSGRRADALRQYDRLAELLDTELGEEPSARVQRLREEISSRLTEEPELAVELWERVGDLRVLAGDGVGAAKAFTRALDASASDASAARVSRKCAEAWLMQHRPETAAAHLENAGRHRPDRQEMGRLLRARANFAWETGDIRAARTFAEEAREIASECGTTEDLAAARETVAIVSHFEGQWRAGLESELGRLAGGGDAGELSRVFDIHHCIGEYHLYVDGLLDSVESYARRILDRAEDAGAVRAQAFAWCLLGESLLLHARWDESDGCLERSCALHDSLGSRSGALPWQRRAEVAACRGDLDQVEVFLSKAAGIATVSPMASHLWGRIYATKALASLVRDEPERAIEAVRAAVAAATRYGDCSTCSSLLNPVAAEAFAKVGDRDGAQSYCEAAERVAGYFPSSAWRAMAETAAGSVAQVEGESDQARRHFEFARDLYERAQQPFWAQRTDRQATSAQSPALL